MIPLHVEQTSPDEGAEQIPNSEVFIEEEEEVPSTSSLLHISMPGAYRSVFVPEAGVAWWKRIFSYLGPGALVAVGYMDPGNWSTDIAGGSAYNYSLLFVILISSLIAMYLQRLCVRLGVATGQDLAQVCKARYDYRVRFFLWFIMEVAIGATDLAEVIGSAIALNLLFGIPIVAGVGITACDVVLVLFLKGERIRVIESLVVMLVLIIAICFAIELAYTAPIVSELFCGFIPTSQLVTDSNMLYVSLGILGATVMPHNLFLHSSLVLTRASGTDHEGKIDAIKYGTLDSTVSLCGAFFVNAAILIVAAAAFHRNGMTNIASLQDAYLLLNPILGRTGASLVFGIALLASGQSSTFTGTIAGQIIMEGFLSMKLRPVFRRLLTRLLAIIPALVCVIIQGESGVNNLLVLSQVILTFALPFGIFPLVQFTSNKTLMGAFVNSKLMTVCAYTIFILISGLNVYMITRA